MANCYFFSFLDWVFGYAFWTVLLRKWIVLAQEQRMERTMENFIWTFLVSLIFFETFDIDTRIYLVAALCVWGILCVQYKYRKNCDFYWKTGIIFVGNFLAFLFIKYCDGYRMTLDAEDCVCIVYGVSLTVNECYLYFRRRNKMIQQAKKKKHLFRERQFDRERLQEYLSIFPMIGINAPWGDGKSFLVDHLEKKDYIVVKIDLLACNLDEIQTVLLNELDKVLKEQGYFSPFSPKLKKILKLSGITENVGQLLVRDDLTYSEAIVGFLEDIKKIDKTILIVYEDLDRIDKPDVIRKVLGISEKIAGENVRIIYQYDEKNLLAKSGFDRKYLEKYIPVTLNLTDIPFSKILDYFFEEKKKKNLEIERENFQFLERPIYPPHLCGGSSVSTSFYLQVPDVTIRKMEYFLNEIILYMDKDKIYVKHKRETILFFLIKYFYNDIYTQLIPGKCLLDIFTFTYDNKKDNIVNWSKFCKQNKIDIMEIFNKKENYMSALMVSLFQYQCGVYEMSSDLEENVNEPVKNLQVQSENEQKDRIVWNLLCNGKSEYTNQRAVIDRLQKEVLSKSTDEQKKAFEKLCDDLFNGNIGEDEKGDNTTIFRLGIPYMVSLFQACRVAGITGEQWITFLEFCFNYRETSYISPELIECLNYCELKERRVYLYIVKKFNQLEIKGNLNTHKSYRIFLDMFLSAFTNLGYIDTQELWNIRNNDKTNVLDMLNVKVKVLEPLRKKLVELKKKIPIEQIDDEIDLLLCFIKKNEELMEAKKELEKPRIRVETKMESRLPNQKEFDRLDALELADEDFRKEVLKAYTDGAVTAYEVGILFERRRKHCFVKERYG